MTCVLHHGDWRDFEWPARCVLITDPPFGIQHRVTSSHTWRGSDRPGFEHRAVAPGPVVAGDRDTSERDAALESLEWVVAAVFGPRRLDRIPPWGDPRDVLVFDKGPGVGAGDLSLPWKPCWETIAVYGAGWSGPRTSAVIRGSKIAFRAGNAANGRRHPTEKPLAVLLELVRKAPPGPIVDPFMGAGSTGVAALLEGRDFYGAELVDEYFGVAQQRLQGVEPYGGQVGLFSSRNAGEP